MPRCRREDGSIDTAAFKIIYVAPMKALVAEMVGNFSKRLEPYDVKVRWAVVWGRARQAGGAEGRGVKQHSVRLLRGWEAAQTDLSASTGTSSAPLCVSPAHAPPAFRCAS